MARRRVALGLSYEGSPWLGWQTQPGGNTVQDELEKALMAFTGTHVPTICAGRTDTGVHACLQVVHLDTDLQRRDVAWIRGLNAHLPESIAVQWAREVPEDFHARFSARARTYVYLLWNRPYRSPLWARRAGWCFRPLDVEAMRAGAAYLLGEHDFSSFRSSQCQAAHPVRVMQRLDIQRHGDMIVFVLKANAFLHHMVRNIIGSLVYVGQGRYTVERMRELLLERDRRRAAPTYSAAGLYLCAVDYPALYGLPYQDGLEIMPGLALSPGGELIAAAGHLGLAGAGQSKENHDKNQDLRPDSA
ncbi:tRNA pseudouridine38-40 synthase [Kerstersia gyiorum]|uniref:tRNA pseudouridine(38-40) synthase TruA n=1 Tax=Kerstersia gyiorum TaxID=206506 RepID=UPI0020A08F1D|nr:tRNA pseudouridine(38-40) synthase TruA [Kerstersia gyiorum]MCP1713548.1 tRNA pseudouridine38-40 synthase [Kerstersia gyiorum]